MTGPLDGASVELQLEIADAGREVERQGHLCPRCTGLRATHPEWSEDDYPLLHAVCHGGSHDRPR
jgi:hypothetical protein